MSVNFQRNLCQAYYTFAALDQKTLKTFIPEDRKKLAEMLHEIISDPAAYDYSSLALGELSVTTSKVPSSRRLLKMVEKVQSALVDQIFMAGGPVTLPIANFRRMPLELGGKLVQVAAMAHPDWYNEDYEQVVKNLKEYGYCRLVSLETGDLEETQKEWVDQKNGSVHSFEIPDFTPPSPAVMEGVFEIVKEAAQNDEGVVIHCREGWGRSGTVMASLKLRELMEKLARDPEALSQYLAEEPSLSEKVKLGHYSSEESTPATPMVKRAIDELRALDSWAGYGAKWSTKGTSSETETQVASLVALELELRQKLLDEGGDTESSSLDTP